MRKNVGDAIRRNTKMDALHETITRGISPDLYSILFYHLYGRLFGVMNPVVNDLAGRTAQQTSR